MDVINPATGEVFDKVAYGGRAETIEAIQSANKAFSDWKNTTAAERSKFLMDFAALMRKRADQLAETITSEMGKPIGEAKREVLSAIGYTEWFAEEAKRVYGETIPPSHINKHLMVLRQPIGVVGAITPWNFPLSMITRKIAPAIAAGCTVVIKPAPATPIAPLTDFG